MKVLKWLLAIVFYHSIMMTVIIFSTLMLPFKLFSDMKQIIEYEIPVESSDLLLISFFGFFVYLAMKSKFLGMPYRKVTFLLPLLQLLLYSSLALSIAILILNKWADEGLYSKQWAIALALLAIVVIRLLISLFYRKYPIAGQKEDD